MKDDLKMMKVAMGLFAVIVIYVMIRKPSESLKPDESSGESVGEFQKFQDDSQSGNAFGKRRASEADWAKVREIAEKFSPQIADLERELFELKDGNEVYFRRGTTDKESAWAKEKERVVNGSFRLEKAIRDLERAQWAAMGEHLSAFELRDYRMEHSFLGRNLREESAWFEPSEGEFLSLFVKQENKNDFADRHFDGDHGKKNVICDRGWQKIDAIHQQHDKTWEEQRAEVEASTDPDIVMYLKYNAIFREVSESIPQMSVARQTLWQSGENASDESVKAQIEVAEIQERKRMGQATIEEVNAARERALEIEIAEMDAEMDAEFAAEFAETESEFEE